MDKDGWMGGKKMIDIKMERQKDRWMDGLMYIWMNGWMDEGKMDRKKIG